MCKVFWPTNAWWLRIVSFAVTLCFNSCWSLLHWVCRAMTCLPVDLASFPPNSRWVQKLIYNKETKLFFFSQSTRCNFRFAGVAVMAIRRWHWDAAIKKNLLSNLRFRNKGVFQKRHVFVGCKQGQSKKGCQTLLKFSTVIYRQWLCRYVISTKCSLAVLRAISKIYSPTGLH